MTTASVPAVPVLSGRDINVAAFATRALLDRLIAESGLPFPRWTALNAIGSADEGAIARPTLVAQQAGALQVDPSTVEATVDALIAQDLIEDGDQGLTLTAAGEALFRPLQTAALQLGADLYRDLPPEDLAITQRTLAEVTRRANLRLAG
jgi:DNA-binding MarR family transcriptional regulator